MRAAFRLAVALAAVALLATGCDEKKKPGAPEAGASKGETPAKKVAVSAEVYAAPKRVVAIGDLHGDLDAAKRALRLGGAIDASDAWVGGDLTVVQVGDQLDRGDEDRELLDFLEALEGKAKEKGGQLIVLLGNHELMNAALDFRFVSDKSFASFEALAKERADDLDVQALPDKMRGRGSALGAGGSYAKKLAKHHLYAIVGDTVFVHGGIKRRHLDYGLEKADEETRAWLEGKRKNPPTVVVAQDGPVWTRSFSENTKASDCDELRQTLASLDKKRMVMGHTVQSADITFACDDKAVRIDTGMSKNYRHGRIEALQIEGDDVKVLKE